MKRSRTSRHSATRAAVRLRVIHRNPKLCPHSARVADLNRSAKKMKRLLLLALVCLLVAGCVHHESLCGNMVFIFVEGEVRNVEANFRDDRLLGSDVIIKGSMTEWQPGPLWKVQGYFTLSVELEAAEPIENVDVLVVCGRQGATGYSSIPIFQAESFAGKKQLVSFDVGGNAPDALIVLQFGKKEDLKRREIEIKNLWNGGPNKPPQTTPGSSAPLRV